MRYAPTRSESVVISVSATTHELLLARTAARLQALGELKQAGELNQSLAQSAAPLNQSESTHALTPALPPKST